MFYISFCAFILVSIENKGENWLWMGAKWIIVEDNPWWGEKEEFQCLNKCVTHQTDLITEIDINEYEITLIKLQDIWESYFAVLIDLFDEKKNIFDHQKTYISNFLYK